MLNQAALPRDVQHLCSPADAEDRHPAAVRVPAQRDLEDVHVVIDRPELGMWLGSVAGRIQIGSARQQQPGQLVQQRIDVLAFQWR